VQEVCRAFVFTKRGTKVLFQMLLPRIQTIFHSFTVRELCYIFYGYSKIGVAPKPFMSQLETKIAETVRDTENVELEILQLVT
jgi:hypothetical protein